MQNQFSNVWFLHGYANLAAFRFWIDNCLVREAKTNDMKINYYDILGVSRDAPPEEIRKQYRKLCKKYHLDKNPGDAGAEERFKKISEAYAHLMDMDKRSAYDKDLFPPPPAPDFSNPNLPLTRPKAFDFDFKVVAGVATVIAIVVILVNVLIKGVNKKCGW